MELWKPISECEGRYEVSNKGHVRNTKTKLILSPRKTPTGYLRVHLRTIEGRKDLYIHRLVANVFCNHPDGCNVINHLDNDPKNNNANNLEWTTQCDNVLYAMSQDRMNGFPNARKVIGIKNGEKIIYRTAREASKITGCDHSTIIKCCKGKKHAIHGYTWKYAEVGA